MRMDSDNDFDHTISSQKVVVSNQTKLATIQDESSHKLPVIVFFFKGLRGESGLSPVY